jgi:predicted nucleotide-binding protein
MSTEGQGLKEVLRALYELGGKLGDGVRIQREALETSVNMQVDTLYGILRTLQNAGFIEMANSSVETHEWYWVILLPKGKEAYEKMAREADQPQDATQARRLMLLSDPSKVAVVYGRNEAARRAIFEFLRAIDLHPMEWSELPGYTGEGTPYVGDIIEKAFSEAQAIVVLMTPDDEGKLKECFLKPDDEGYEKQLTPQPRLNVVFEAGMAFGHNPKRTILVELGSLRHFSNVGGRHTVRLDDNPEKRKDLAQRLRTAGCPVNLDGTDWLKAGHFLASLDQPSREDKEKKGFVISGK